MVMRCSFGRWRSGPDGPAPAELSAVRGEGFAGVELGLEAGQFALERGVEQGGHGNVAAVKASGAQDGGLGAADQGLLESEGPGDHGCAHGGLRQRFGLGRARALRRGTSPRRGRGRSLGPDVRVLRRRRRSCGFGWRLDYWRGHRGCRDRLDAGRQGNWAGSAGSLALDHQAILSAYAGRIRSMMRWATSSKMRTVVRPRSSFQAVRETPAASASANLVHSGT